MSSWSVRLLRISLRIHHLVCRLLWRPPTPTPMAKRASPRRRLDPGRSAPCNCSASHSQAASKMETLKFNDWAALHFAIAGPGFRALGLRRAAQVLPVVELERPLSEASQGELFNSPSPRCLGLTAVLRSSRCVGVSPARLGTRRPRTSTARTLGLLPGFEPGLPGRKPGVLTAGR